MKLNYEFSTLSWNNNMVFFDLYCFVLENKKAYGWKNDYFP